MQKSLNSLLVFVSLVSPFIPCALSECSDNQFWGVKVCDNYVTHQQEWSCYSCTSSNSIQYCKFPGSKATSCVDEVCVCKNGFYASSYKMMCASYDGNGGVVPPFEDIVSCTKCSDTSICYGGAKEEPYRLQDGTYGTRGYAHQSKSECPFPNMVSKSPLPPPAFFCERGDAACSEVANIRRMCLATNNANCPCECPDTSVFMDDQTAPDDKSCQCMPGTYWNSTNSSKIMCTPCPQNSYCPGGSKSDQIFQCPLGWKTVGTNAVFLYECSICTEPPCAVGTFCKPPTRFTAAELNISKSLNKCGKCPVGHRCPSGKDAIQCIPGTYQGAEGQSECKTCAAGNFSTQIASTACTTCQPGKYQADPGQTGCALCPAGKMQPLYAQGNCKLCSKGTYQQYQGQSSCMQCPEGTSSRPDAELGQVSVQGACTTCQPGGFASLVEIKDGYSKYECKQCPEGECAYILQKIQNHVKHLLNAFLFGTHEYQDLPAHL